MLRIGSLALSTPLMLAPIAGYCDLAFRLTIRPLGGLGLAWTDLINPRGLLRQTARTRHLVATEPADRPLAIQLYGCDPAEMAAAAQWCESHGAAVVDVNMGCPAAKICRRRAGGALLQDPETAVRVIARMAAAVRIPVTAKMRLGWSGGDLTAAALARAIEDAGAAAVIVHGRSVEAGFAGSVCLDGIARVVEAVRGIPVIGNGDVRSPTDARAMLDRTGCAGVMIGRAALREPWIFRDAFSWLTAGRILPPPTVSERIERVNMQFSHLLRLRGERAAVVIFRQRFSWYAHKLGVTREFRDAMRQIQAASDYHRLMNTLRS